MKTPLHEFMAVECSGLWAPDENLISNNFRRKAVLKKISVVTRALLLSIPLEKLRALHALGDLEPLL